MKKLKFIFICLSVILLIPSLYACKKGESKIQLATPSFVNMIDEEDNRILVTDNNINASSYVFGICNCSEYKDDLTKYIRYASSKNYLDVSNIFTSSTTYYFYVQAIGNEKYSNSLYSAKNFYDNTKYLSTPRLIKNNYILSWTEIKNADSYDIYLNDEFAFNSTTNSVNLQTFNNGIYLNSNFVLNFKVKAKPTLISGYKESAFSNIISVSEHLIPTTPTLSISKTEDFTNSSVTLNWNNCDNETGYLLKVVGYDIKYYNIEKNTTSIDLKTFYNKETSSFINLVEQIGDYSFSIQALGENNTKSNFSNAVNFKRYIKLSQPQILLAEKKDDGIIISLNVDDKDVKSVHIALVDNENNIVYENNYLTNQNNFSIIILKKDLEDYNNIKSVTAYSNAYGNYYYSSNLTQKNF